jgi:hypothetical protein
VNGFVVGVNVVPPPALMVNVQLGVGCVQERVIEVVVDPGGVMVTNGTAGWITVIGNAGDDAGPKIPRKRHATVKLSVVDVPGTNALPLGYGIVAIPTESTDL